LLFGLHAFGCSDDAEALRQRERGMLLESAFEAKVEFTIARGVAGCPVRQ
jgi:hypothetical protein